MTPPNEHHYERRRAEDVFRVVEEEVFPRLGSIDTKIDSLEHSVNRLTIDGCAQRKGDLHRTEVVEANAAKIFEKIDGFSTVLANARVDLTTQVGGIRTDVQKQIGGIRAWVLTGVVVVLLAISAFLLQEHYSAVQDHLYPSTQGVGKK